MKKDKKKIVNNQKDGLVSEEKRKFLKQTACVTALGMLGTSVKALALDLQNVDIQDDDMFLSGKGMGFETFYPGRSGHSVSMDSASHHELLRQIEVITKAAATRKDRAEFIGDPFAYARKLDVDLHQELADRVSEELLEIEKRAASFGQVNPHLFENGVDLGFVEEKKGAQGHAAGAVVSAAAVVAAAASVTMAYTSATATGYC